MAQEVHSFWTEIKKYEDILVKEPNSYCFAQLSELYRKIGLLDDAIFVAKRGVEIHPDYVGGHLALGRAYFDKGQKANSREELEQVVKMTPENYIAQKLLSQIYLEQNDIDLAEKTLVQVLDLNPDDVESRLSLEALARSSEEETTSDASLEDEYDLEEADIIEEDDDLLALERWSDEPISVSTEAGEEVTLMGGGDAAPLWDAMPEDLPDTEDLKMLTLDIPMVEAAAQPADPQRDPLTTATLADIYLAQGFHDQALSIYRELAVAAPDNEEVQRRIAEIELLKSVSPATPPAQDDTPSFADTFLVADPPEEPAASAPEPKHAQEADVDQSLAELEAWLEGIDKRRECR